MRALGNCYFNPRPPRGGRLRPMAHSDSPKSFQSTPPARGATADGQVFQTTMVISIHAPREGGDGAAGIPA